MDIMEPIGGKKEKKVLLSHLHLNYVLLKMNSGIILLFI